jgi:pyruvate dehydrogenase E1 component alpha subunit
VTGTDAEGCDLQAAYRWMVLSRAIEDRLRNVYTTGGLRGRLISGRGQEAIPVGSAMALGPGDVIGPVHRDLGAHLVRGTEPIDILRHYLGRATSLSQGRDGDVHMGDWSKGVFPMVSHLPDSWPVLGGVALGFQLDGSQRVAMGYAGDGAMSTGAWHEAVNFAAVFDLPVVYIVENNQYAYSTPLARQSKLTRLSDRAAGYGLPGVTVDGNDVAAVFDASTAAVDRARRGLGPTIIECVTMRMDGHAIHDSAPYVPEELLAHWRLLDPIDQLQRRLETSGHAPTWFDTVRKEQDLLVRESLAQAQAEPLPDASTLLDGVYAELG